MRNTLPRIRTGRTPRPPEFIWTAYGMGGEVIGRIRAANYRQAIRRGCKEWRERLYLVEREGENHG